MKRIYLVFMLSVGAMFATACGPSAEYLEEQRKLQAELAKMRRQSGTCADQLGSCQAQNNEYQKQVADLTDKIEKLESKLSETQKNLETALAKAQADANKQAEQFKDLQRRLHDAIAGGKIKVTMRKGRVVITLANDVLFDSGKIQLKAEGQAALDQVAQALSELSDRRFIVFGNTDNIPIKTARFPSNWELSADRAVEVVKFLINRGMKPENITAAGSGEFDPIKDNSLPEGQRQNRRIEIVLEPDLTNLPGISE